MNFDAQPLVRGDMKIIHPDNIVELLNQGLADRRATLPGYGLPHEFFNTLLARPEFARHPKIYPPELGPIVYLTKESFTDCPPTPVQRELMATRYEIPRPGAIDPNRVTGYVDIIITRKNFWDIQSVPNDSGGIEERVMNARFGLPLEGFGVEFEKACTALGRW